MALLKAAKPPSGLLVLLQALTAHKFIQSGAQNTYYSQAGSQACLSQQQPEGAAAAVDADDAGAADAAGLPATQGTGGGRLVPACVQAHAWIALGKVCLVDEALAKKCVPLFVQVRLLCCAEAAAVDCVCVCLLACRWSGAACFVLLQWPLSGLWSWR